MSEDAQPSSPDEPRSRGWSKLRDKLKEKDYKLPFKKHNDRQPAGDVEDFLRSGNSSASLPPERPSIPRINTATESPPWATQPDDLVDEKWRPTKPLRRSGLCVNFVTANPVIIGEGGDEAESAPILVSQFKNSDLERSYVSHARQLSENNAIQRKATIAHPANPTTSPPFPPAPFSPTETTSAASDHTRPPKLPDVSTLTFHDQPPISDIPPLPAYDRPPRESRRRAGTGAHPGPVTGKNALQIDRQWGDRQQELQQRSENSHDLYQPVPKISQPEAHSDVLPPSSPSANKMFEMHAAEGMAHRNSIRSSIHKDVKNTLRAHSPHSSVSSIDGPSEAIASLEGIASAESSRPTSSRHSRYSVSPEPSSFAADGYPLSPSASASSGHQYLVPPGSSHGSHSGSSQALGGRPFQSHQTYTPQQWHSDSTKSAEHLPSPPPAPRTAFAATVPSTIPALTPTGHTGEIQSTADALLVRPRPTAPMAPPPLPSPPFSRQTEPYQLDQRQGPTVDGVEALAEFADFANSARQIFRLSSERSGSNASLHEWQCCALWWFLKARSGLEDFARSNPPRQAGVPDAELLQIRQHHVNLAKSWWILEDVLQASTLSGAAHGPGASAVHASSDALKTGFLSLCASMKRRNILPTSENALMQGLETSIWTPQPMLDYPSEWSWVLSGSAFASTSRKPPFVTPLECLPVNDTKSSFCYGRIFAQASAATSDEETPQRPFDCVVSVIRSRKSPELEAMITSQTSSATVAIKTVEEAGVHWEHTRFDHELHALRIKLPHKLRLWISCSPRDYTWLWSCFDTSQKIARSLRPHSDEVLLANFILSAFQYRDSGRPDDFPTERVEMCRAAIFERFASPEDGAKRKTHRGYRLAIMTTNKVIRNVTFAVGVKAPVEYALASGIPEMRILIRETDRGRSAHLNFLDFRQRDMFRDLITGTAMKPTEQTMCSLTLKGVSAGPVVQGVGPSQWIRHNFNVLQVIDEADPEDSRAELSSSDTSETLRVTMFSNLGSVVDRLCDASMEVRIRLEAMRPHELQIMRPAAREDMTIALGPDSGGDTALRPMFNKVTSGPSALSYEFTTTRDVHIFQKALTGYSVLFDGIASTFSIARRRMYVGKDKNWDAANARIQVVEREGRHQLLAFFDSYIVADCLNFEVKRTDTFEQIAGGKASAHGVKLVDAKFTLPGSNKDDWLREGAQRDPAAKYMNLATEEYAAEHEDILVFFDKEEERDRFGSALPAPVTSARKFTLMRRI